MKYLMLVNVYLYIGQHCDGWLYRKFGIVCINLYQRLISSRNSGRCQFRITCSQFLKEQLLAVGDFKTLNLNMKIRIEDCSQPLTATYSNITGVNARGGSGKKYSEYDLSNDLITKIKTQARQVN